jgi:hypothetical protein
MVNIIKLDAITGQEIVTELSAAEIKAREADYKAAQAEKEAEIEAKIAAKQMVLDRLGITADEAALLLG